MASVARVSGLVSSADKYFFDFILHTYSDQEINCLIIIVMKLQELKNLMMVLGFLVRT